jgi:SAM-dependent methyltransferase
MAHKEQFEFIQRVREAFPDFFQGNRVLEIGSLDINGTVRGFFNDCEYLGLDVAAGKGVDLVCEGQTYDAPDGAYDLVISCEAMEHNPHWKETMDNMIRLTRPGGLIIMSCATIGRPEHGTARSEPTSSPLTVEKGWDYYWNLTPTDVQNGIKLGNLAAWRMACNWDSYDLYFLGIKAPAPEAQAVPMHHVFEYYDQRFWSTLKWLRRSVRQRLKSALFGVR